MKIHTVFVFREFSCKFPFFESIILVKSLKTYSFILKRLIKILNTYAIVVENYLPIIVKLNRFFNGVVWSFISEMLDIKKKIQSFRI